MASSKKSFRNAVLKSSEYATDMANLESIYECKTYIDSGNVMLNMLLSGKFDGGYPAGRIITLSGEAGAGKSMLIMKGLLNFLKKHEDNQIVLYETEGAVLADVIPEELRERFLVVPVQTIEEFSKSIVKLVDKYQESYAEEIKAGETRVLFALDSLGNLAFEKEITDSETGKSASDMGLKAKKFKQLGRNICMKLAKIRTALIVSNHIYANPNAGMYATRKERYAQSGGSGIVYLSSIIINLEKALDREQEKGTKFKRASKAKIKAILDKSRFIREDSFIRFTIDFDKGINSLSGLIEFFDEFNMFEKVTAQTYKFLDFTGRKKELIKFIITSYLTDKDKKEQMEKLIQDKICYGNCDLVNDDYNFDDILEDETNNEDE